MDYLGRDNRLTSEYSGTSVDDILAQFKAEMAMDAAAERARPEKRADTRTQKAKNSRGEHVSMPSKRRNKRRRYERRETADTTVSAENEYMTEDTAAEDEGILAPAADDSSAPAAAEEPYSPAPGPLPAAAETYATPAPKAEHRTEERSAQYEPAPRKSARPSDDEVRSFLDAYRRGDFLDLHDSEPTEPQIDPDERFYMGGERTRRLTYGDKDVDMSADANYVPPKSSEYISSYADESDDEPDEPDEPEGFAAKLSSMLRRRPRTDRSVKAERAVRSEPNSAREDETPEDDGFESSFTDYKSEDYAVRREFDSSEREEIFDEDVYPKSFREYFYSIITSLLYGLRRGGAGARTMNDSDEDLGRELSCAKASKYYGSFIRSMRLRLRISAVILFVMAWISLGLPVPGMLKTAAVSSAVCLGLQLGIMLLCLDTLTTGIMNTVRGKFGADGMAVAACLLTSLDAILVAKAGVGTPHLALCFISSLSLVGTMFAAVLHARSMRKALRVPAIGKRCFAVTAETDPRSGDITVLKSVRPPLGFVRRSEQSAPDEDLFRKISLPLLALSFVLALIIAIVKRDLADFAYIFSAVFCPAVPFAAMCCFSLPFFLGSMRIFSSGAAVAGWSGMNDIGQSKNLIVTDRDLFPDGTVEIGTIRIFADEDPTRIISYAGSLMAAAGSCSAPPFGELMERNGCRMRNIENFEYLSGGGMKGIIDGSVILCGSTDLMRLMNVRVPFRLVDKTSVLLAVDGILCGIFNMKYTAKPQVRAALIDLMRSNRHPVFAIRDFNVTPEMLHAAFDVATDGYDFPPYVDRFGMSSAEPSEDSQISAVICREGLGPLVHAADTARSMYTATRINTALTAASALLGVIVTAIKLLGGSVSIGFIFAFMLVFALLSAAVSFFTRT